MDGWVGVEELIIIPMGAGQCPVCSQHLHPAFAVVVSAIFIGIVIIWPMGIINRRLILSMGRVESRVKDGAVDIIQVLMFSLCLPLVMCCATLSGSSTEGNAICSPCEIGPIDGSQSKTDSGNISTDGHQGEAAAHNASALAAANAGAADAVHDGVDDNDHMYNEGRDLLPPMADEQVCPDAKACLQSGMELLNISNVEEALAHLSTAVQHAPEWELARLYLAKGMRESRKQIGHEVEIVLGQTALGHLRIAVELGSFNPQTYYLVAQEFDDGGDVGKAIEAYRRSLELRGDNLQARIRLGLLLQSQGSNEEALEHLEAAYSQDRNHIVVNTQLASLYEKLGMIIQAEQCLVQLCKMEKAAPWPFANLAAFYERHGLKGKEEKARAEAERRRAAQIDGGKSKVMRPLPQSR